MDVGELKSIKTKLSKLWFYQSLFFSILISVPSTAAQVGHLFTYEGVLTDSSGNTIATPPQAPQDVTFEVIYDSSCIVYAETQSVSTGVSGEFSVIIGTGTRADSTGNTSDRIFASQGQVNCDGKASVPVTGSEKLKLHIRVGSTDLYPDVTITTVPFSVTAKTLNGKVETDFVNTNAVQNLTQANIESIFNRFTKLDAILNNVDASGSNLSANITGNAATATTAVNVTGTVALANGGTGATTQAGAANAILPSQSTNAGKYLTTDGTSISWANVSAGTGATELNTAGAIVKRDASGNFTANTISANLTGNVTGAASLNLLKTGDTVTGNLTFSSNTGSVYTDSTTNTVSIYAPASLISSYSLKLPMAQGASNQVLTNDGAGNLSWTTASTTASSYSGVLPIVNGGTNSSTILNNNRIMVSSGNAIVEASALTNGQLLIGSTSAAPVAATLTAGSGIAITSAAGAITIGTTGLQASSLANGMIWVGQTGTPTAVTPSGNATMTNAGVFKVTGIQGTSVSATSPSAAGQVLRYDGISAYAPAFLGLADIKSGITPFVGAFTNAGCIASQSLYWQSSTDTFECQSVAIGDSQITYASKTANTFLAAPSGTAGAPTFRGIASSDLPTTGTNGAYVNGGNSFGSAATLGTNDNNTFGIKTNNTTRMTVDVGGKVGIGTLTPQALLDVAGDIKIGNSGSVCGASNEGQQRYNQTVHVMEYCDGSRWVGIGQVTSCPSGYTLVGVAGSSEAFCIYSSVDNITLSWHNAITHCHQKNPSAHLCSVSERILACSAGALTAAAGIQEWASDVYSDTYNYVSDSNIICTSIRTNANSTLNYPRCCVK